MMSRRIGFLLANVYQGSSVSMWKAMAGAAQRERDSALFVFPGGRLRHEPGNEFLRNGIYELANSSSLDGAIIWTSALSGSVGSDEAAFFTKAKAGEIPVVSLGMMVDGCPSVDFDAYSGMYAETEHMITVHGDKRIAFIRGPESHRSAEARLEAYRSALAHAGIGYDASLVSSPVSWSDGAEAARELVETRGLVPGRDFTALIAASDMLLLSAFRYLESIGVRVPQDLRVAGFNDNDENILMSIEPTTVRLPIVRLAASAYGLISSLCDSGREGAPDILLSTDLIIRHSCGCKGLPGGEGAVSADDMLRLLVPRIENPESISAARSLITYLSGEGDDHFLMEAAESFVASGGDADALFEAVSLLPGLSAERKDRLFLRMISEERRASAGERQRMRTITSALDGFKTSLLAAKSRDELARIMQEAFCGIGIEKCFLMLYDDFSYTLFIGGFSSSSLYEGLPERFPRRQIAPDSLLSELSAGTFVIEPLFYDSQELGYIVVGTEWCEGYVLEDIRTSLSSALKGISLFEAASEAKEKAEEGERNAEEFYAKVSEGVMQPLADIRTSLMGKGRISRSGILGSVMGAERLLELALAERGEMTFSKTFVPLSSLVERLVRNGLEVSAPSELPLLEMDISRISEAVLVISSSGEGMSGKAHVSLGGDGVTFSIEGGAFQDDTSFKLAERIVVMHSGIMRLQRHGVSITLPYPRLGEGGGEGGGIVCICGDDSSLPEGLEAEVHSPEELPSLSPAAIAVRMTDPAGAAAVLAYTRTHQVPLIVYSDKEGFSLRTILEEASSSHFRTIAVFGQTSSFPRGLSETGSLLEVTDIGSLSGYPGRISLVALHSADISLITGLRQMPHLASVPVLIIQDTISGKDMSYVETVPNVMVVNTSVLESGEFLSRLVSIADGADMLPPFTGILVKKAIVYINEHATRQISRWQLAGAVNISEDYLTRIFRKELGISPWDYINRYRIQIASHLLVSTGRSLSQIADDAGFQDQAYFCRVFKKIKGFPPGHMRQRSR